MTREQLLEKIKAKEAIELPAIQAMMEIHRQEMWHLEEKIHDLETKNSNLELVKKNLESKIANLEAKLKKLKS